MLNETFVKLVSVKAIKEGDSPSMKPVKAFKKSTIGRIGQPKKFAKKK